MAAQILLVLCASALYIQSAVSQCIGREAIMGPGFAGPYGAGWPYEGLPPFDGWGYGGAWAGAGCGAGLSALAPANGLAAGYGGGLAITSASPIAPTGLTVSSENAIEGALVVVGQLPFLGAVATDGVFPTAGAGAVSYGCGDGAIGITAEGAINAPTAAGYGPGRAPYGYGPAAASYNGIAPFGGCGCGANY